MTPTSQQVTPPRKPRMPRVLVVDPARSPAQVEVELRDAGVACRVMHAATLADALKLIGRAVAPARVDLLLTPLELPDGHALALLPELRKACPGAAAVVTGQSMTAGQAIDAFRAGADDVLAEGLAPTDLGDRLRAALRRGDALGRQERQIARLKSAVRRLSQARNNVGRKVDLLCNDLVGAYGELSRQVDQVRTAEDFRKLCDTAKDLEQLLCHAMDWVMRRVGYSNIAVFLAGDETFQLGAYVKYTTPSDPELTEALRDGLLKRATREGFVRMSAEEARGQLSAGELKFIGGQAVVAANCTYLGETLATMILFRDGQTPFTHDDAETFRAIAPLFAISLATQTRGEGEGEGESAEGEDGGTTAEGEEGGGKPKGSGPDADWWKRGEAPPF